MTKTEYTLNYPESSGFSHTSIHFYPGQPELDTLFNDFPGDGQRCSCGKDSGIPARLFVTDTTIAALAPVKDFISKIHDAHGNDIVLVLGAGEKYKTMDSVLSIVRTALDANLGRNCIFIAIGGGVICDMTGFAASIFKRGVSVSFVPTTLLAMVDASIGGKTGCDFEGYKNMVGSFYPASDLHIWSSFVQTLPQNEYRSGLAEAIKTALLFSPELFDLFCNDRDAIMERDPVAIEKMISTCVKAKALVVQEDFRERGKRALLNYGHTFGHAFESVAGLGAVPHGDAVAWGIGRALDLGVQLGQCDASSAAKVKELLSEYGYDMTATPLCLQRGNAKDLLEAMHKDKKNSGGTLIKVITQNALCDNVIQEVDESALLKVLTK